MPSLSVRNLEVTFVDRTLFRGVSFDVEARDKMGFIGANGVGKTTLFRVLSGELSPTFGTVAFEKNTRVGYMEQHSCKNPEVSVFDELVSVFGYLMDIERETAEVTAAIENKSGDLSTLVERQTALIEEYENRGGLTYKSRTRSALLGLGFSEKDFDMQVGSLSGGQRSKLCLAKLLLSESNFLLLDEPTNHLDIKSVGWLEDFLRDFKGAMIIISHDRYFLDNVTNKTVELEHQKAMCYKGAYSEFVKKKQAYNESLKNKYENDIKEIKRIEGIVEQQKRWGRERNFITAASRQKEADRIKAQLVAPDSELETMRIRFEPKFESGNDVLICRNIEKAFGEKQLFTDVNIHIRKGERVFILGENGCGKTTLFKILTGKIPQDRGEFECANVMPGYFDQMQQNLDLSKTAIDEVWDRFPNLTQTEVRSALAAFLFKGDDVFKPLSKMSGGERARVSLLKLMLQGSNFLLLDEPTNHLDAASREELENTLLDYGGTLLIISHDRYFINKLADRVLALDKNGVKEYLGNYDYYFEHVKTENQAETSTEQKPKQKPQNEYFLNKQRASEERKRQTKLKKTEAEIERLDGEIERVSALLTTEEVASDYERLIELTNELEQLNSEQEKQYEIWEELSD